MTNRIQPRKQTAWIDQVREVKPPQGMDPRSFAALMGYQMPEPIRVVKQDVPVYRDRPQLPPTPAPQHLTEPTIDIQELLLQWVRAGGPTGQLGSILKGTSGSIV